MAVTLDGLGVHVLGKREADLSDRERADLSGLLAWAVALVEQYGAQAPAAVTDAAVSRVCYFDWHSRLSRRPADGGMLDRPPRGVSLNPLRASGAMALLSPYLQRRAT